MEKKQESIGKGKSQQESQMYAWTEDHLIKTVHRLKSNHKSDFYYNEQNKKQDKYEYKIKH